MKHGAACPAEPLPRNLQRLPHKEIPTRPGGNGPTRPGSRSATIPGISSYTLTNLYGTTIQGGSLRQSGAAFELTPNAARSVWTETVLHRFCVETDCNDGANPYAGLILDGAGNLYGTTVNGGSNNGGVVFELLP